MDSLRTSRALIGWIRKVLGVDSGIARELIPRIVEVLTDAGYLVIHDVRRCGRLWMIPHQVILLQITDRAVHPVWPRCTTVHLITDLTK